MANSELPDLDITSLETRLVEKRDEVFKLRFQRATGQLENHRAIRLARREVARILTELRHREIAEAEAHGEGSR